MPFNIRSVAVACVLVGGLGILAGLAIIGPADQSAAKPANTAGDQSLEKQVEALRAAVRRLESRIDQLEEEIRKAVPAMMRTPGLVPFGRIVTKLKDSPGEHVVYTISLRVEEARQKEIADLVAKNKEVLTQKIASLIASHARRSLTEAQTRNRLEQQIKQIFNEVAFPHEAQSPIKQLMGGPRILPD